MPDKTVLANYILVIYKTNFQKLIGLPYSFFWNSIPELSVLPPNSAANKASLNHGSFPLCPPTFLHVIGLAFFGAFPCFLIIFPAISILELTTYPFFYNSLNIKDNSLTRLPRSRKSRLERTAHAIYHRFDKLIGGNRFISDNF